MPPRSRLPAPSPRWLVAVLAGLSTACPEDPPDPPPASMEVRLAEADGWVHVSDPAADVFGAERPSDATCDTQMGITLEDFGPDQVIEIFTDLCNHATLAQPSAEALSPGDTITIRIWHYDLMAPEPAQAHLALAIDGEVWWERTLPIPSPADLITEEIEVDREVPAGAELQFHVHNHGYNAYDLISLEATVWEP